MAPLKPEWCARAPVNAVNKSFGVPKPLPARQQKENRYKPKTKSMVDCGRPKAMDAPRRKASDLLIHVPVSALGKPEDGSDGRWARSKPVTIGKADALRNADVVERAGAEPARLAAARRLLQERDARAEPGGVEGDRRADDAATDDENVAGRVCRLRGGLGGQRRRRLSRLLLRKA